MDPWNTRNLSYSRYTSGTNRRNAPGAGANSSSRNTRRIVTRANTSTTQPASSISTTVPQQNDPQPLATVGSQVRTINSSRVTTSLPAPVPAPSPAPAPAPSQRQVYITSPNRFTNTTGENIEGYRHTLTENLSNGDCFFSGIYRALQTWDAQQSGALLRVVHRCNGRFVINNGEDAFIQSARDILADKILGGALESIYNRLLEVFYNTPDDIPAIVSDYQSYFQQIILNRLSPTLNPSGDFYTPEEFYALVANEIRKSGTWVSELEVTLFKEILNECRILLDWYSDISPVPTLLPKMYNDMFVINLHVIRGRHYQHYVLSGSPRNIRLRRLDHSFAAASPTAGGRRKMKTRKQKSKKRLNKSRKHK